MITSFVTPHTGQPMSVKLDGISYIFHITEYEHRGEFAPIIIEDTSTKNRYRSEGFIEINGRLFISKWKAEFDPDTCYWKYGSELVVEVF